MYSLITKLVKHVKSRPLFSGSFLILCCIIGATQYQYWFGLYSSSNLKDLKEEGIDAELIPWFEDKNN